MTGAETFSDLLRRIQEMPRGEYEWDQANDPLMINKTIPVIVSNMEAPYCLSEHRDDWGLLHVCIRAHGHTGRHYASNYGGHYVTAVWK